MDVMWLAVSFVLILASLAIMNQFESMNGLKTKVFNLGVVVLGALEGFEVTDLANSPEQIGTILSGLGITGVALREMTKKS